MRAELARGRSQKQETIRPRYTLVRDFDCPGSSVIFVSTLMTHETSQIAKATTLETIATIQKATLTHEQAEAADRGEPAAQMIGQSSQHQTAIEMPALVNPSSAR